MQEHGEEAALAAAANGADDRAAALTVYELNGQDRVELGERLRRGVAQKQRVQRQQAHRRSVPPALQGREGARRADARQQLEPARWLWA